MIKVAIADDHPMVRNGICQMLASCELIRIEGLYSNGVELLAGLQEKQPDVLLLDIHMPGMQGDEIAARLAVSYPEIKIIAVTNFDHLLHIRNMLEKGVLGYLLKTTEADTLIEAITTVAAGAIYIEPGLRQKAATVLHPSPQNKYHKLALTLREREIVQLLAAGYSNQQIAEKLFISYNTMRNHRARIFFKLDVATLGELIKKAMDLGIS